MIPGRHDFNQNTRMSFLIVSHFELLILVNKIVINCFMGYHFINYLRVFRHLFAEVNF
jgi:hypothetical protein